MRGLFGAVLVLLCLIGCATPSQARHGLAATIGACPQGTTYLTLSGVDDGCAEAPTTLSYLDTGWYSTTAAYDVTAGARQNGQVWAAPHAQGWNIAGVDYPVGYDAAYVTAHGGWKDPATSASALSAIGCAYNATGDAGSPKVTCTTGASGLDFEGWNMKNASGGCTQLEVNAGSGSTATNVTIKNDLFGQPTVASGLTPCSNGNLFFINIRSCLGDTHYLVSQVTFDMDGEEYPYGVGGRGNLTAALGITCPTSTSMVVTYNAFLEGPQKQFQFTNLEPYPAIEMYNFVRNFNIDDTGHGEFFFHGEDYAGDPVGTADKFEFNTVLFGNQAVENDATMWCTRGNSSNADGVFLCDMENNTLVANYNINSGNATVSDLFIENGGTPVVTMIVLNNYFDIGLRGALNYGADLCIKSQLSITNLTRANNVSLQNGMDQSANLFASAGATSGHCG